MPAAEPLPFHLPEVEADALGVRDVALRLAAIKAIKDVIEVTEKELRATALTLLDPGDRKIAVLPGGGAVVGTLSYVVGSTSWKVVDEAAFTRWVQEHRPSAIVPSVRSSDAKSILTEITTTGVVPDGVDEVDRGGYTMVRQTPEQAQALLAVRNWRRLLGLDVSRETSVVEP